MRQFLHPTLALLALFILTTTLFAAVVQYYDAKGDANGITVRWGMQDQSGVAKFDVYRKEASSTVGSWTWLASIQARTDGGKDYSYLDNAVFKDQSRAFKYKIQLVSTSGAEEAAFEVTASYDGLSSTAKRTWGSIKAMFR